MSDKIREPSKPKVSVITPTRSRVKLLERAMGSVASQKEVVVEHIVVGDRCPELGKREVYEYLAGKFPQAKIFNLSADEHPALTHPHIPTRLAYLRNYGLNVCAGEYVAHLDDDNTYDPDHLASLVEVLMANPDAGASYSWRKLCLADGAPFVITQADPWAAELPDERFSFARLQAIGVFQEGSSIMRDTFMTDGGEFIGRVDASEYLLRRDIQMELRFSSRLGDAETFEDMVLTNSLHDRKIAVLPSGKATLNYVMGGFSNGAGRPA
jgi:glycosyltransferase involved in cell wall biosynthesis